MGNVSNVLQVIFYILQWKNAIQNVEIALLCHKNNVKTIILHNMMDVILVNFNANHNVLIVSVVYVKVVILQLDII